VARPYVLKNPAPPEVRREKAVKARAAQNTAPYLVGRLVAANPVDEIVAELVAAAPPLTDAQRARLAVLLAPVGGASQ